jgi:ketosteroid isomerase-like protein
MSSANLDLVRSIEAPWERGDFSSAEWAHPEIELVIIGGPTPGSWTGLAGMTEGMRDWLSAWQEFRFKADEYRELDGERVLVLADSGGRGKTSGLELGPEMGQTRAKGAHLFYIRDGQVTRFIVYTDRAHALADVGLAEEAG